MEIQNVEISGTQRVGGISNEADDKNEAKPRPLKVTLQSKGVQNEILQKAKNLRGSGDGEARKLFISPNLTPKQREEGKLLREQRRMKQEELTKEGETDFMWIIKFNRLRKVRRRMPEQAATEEAGN